jgi:hypothetical protein
MPRLPKGKVQLNIYLDEELAKKLRSVVKAKYESLRGLSREVELALRAWLEKALPPEPSALEEARTRTTRVKSSTKSSRDGELERVKEEVLSVAKPGDFITYDSLERVVLKACDIIDERGVRSRIRKLAAMGFIEFVGEEDGKEYYKVVGEVRGVEGLGEESKRRVEVDLFGGQKAQVSCLR